ncbi:molybdenum cofactor biosynthesis protein [Trypanosoma cruzi cruzi]|nr:molybdenum cofactor biosynthesis protein [Trypanosoma cruzi cruzi]
MFRLATLLLAKKKPLKPPSRRGRAAAVATTARRTMKSPARRRLPSRTRTPAKRAGGKGETASVIPNIDAPNRQPHHHHDKKSSGDEKVGTNSNMGSGVANTSSSGSDKVAVRTTAMAKTTEATVDTSEKKPPYCLATAVSTIVVPPAANFLLENMRQTLAPSLQRPNDGGVSSSSSEETRSPVSQMEEFYTSKKGPLFATAVIAGTNAVKQASQLIPFCHPVRIQKCSFTFRRRVVAGLSRTSALPHRVVLRKRVSPPPPPSRARGECSVLYCFCTVASDDSKAGVEMEALTGASVAGLTLYDMLRTLPGSQEDGLSIGESFVLAKRGGKSDFTKILMSELENVPEPPNAPAPTPPATRDTGGEETAGMLTEGGATPPSAAAAAQSESEGNDDKSKSDAPASSSSGGGHEQPQRDSGGTPGDADDNAATPDELEEKGAWWKSTAREKKLQQLHPRRRYESQEKTPMKAESPPTKKTKSTPATTAAATTAATAVRRNKPTEDAPAKKKMENKMRLKMKTKVAKIRPKRLAIPLAKRRVESSIPEDNTSAAADDADDQEDVVVAMKKKRKKKENREVAVASNNKRAPLKKTAVHDSADVDDDSADVDNDEEGEEEFAVDKLENEDDLAPPARREKKRPRRNVRETAKMHDNVADDDKDDEADEDDDDEEIFHEEEAVDEAREYDDDEEEEELPARRQKAAKKRNKTPSSPPPRRARGSEVTRPVRHDSWDNETEVESEFDQDDSEAHEFFEEEEGEEEKPPPTHRKKKTGKTSRTQRQTARR